MQLKAMSDSLPPSQLQQPDGEVNAISKGKETEDRRTRGRATRWPETNQSSLIDAEIAFMPKFNNVQLVEQNVTTATNVVISAKFANPR